MSATTKRLKALCRQQPKFLHKGGLCVALVVTETASHNGLPLSPESLRTKEEGQVAGLGKAAVQRILERHGITKVLAEEGGRTSRGSLGLMKEYVAALNDLHKRNTLNLPEAETWWIQRVQDHFASEGPRFHYDPAKSLRRNIEDLLQQAEEIQDASGGTTYVGAMLQHLVGAKLDLVLGPNAVEHHGFSVADQSTRRKGDFRVHSTLIHVTTHPNEAVIRKCAGNLGEGTRPLIITLGEKKVAVAIELLDNANIADRVDVWDAVQFLSANVFERSMFRAPDCKVTLKDLLKQYNDIVSNCETDPSLKVNLGASEA